MLGVLMELDGREKAASIASKTGLNVDRVCSTLRKLWKLKLVEPVADQISFLDEDFFEYLHFQLSLAVGPIAEILVEDTVTDLNDNQSGFPSRRAAELVDVIAREIQRTDSRTRFQQNMLKKIVEKGY
jgi:hypothetical protein